jgi:hypothetical protein
MGTHFRHEREDPKRRPGVVQSEVNFRYAYVGFDLRFTDARCEGQVDLGQSEIKRKLHLHNALFSADVKLYDASIGTLVIRRRIEAPAADGSPDPVNAGFPLNEGACFELSGCTFGRLEAGCEHAARGCDPERKLVDRFLEAQRPETFSPDPYRHLERYYRSEGDAQRANEIYLLGRQALHENAVDPNGATRWSRFRMATDWVIGFTTRWGLWLWGVFGFSVGIVTAWALFCWQLEWLYIPVANQPDEVAKVASFWSSLAYSFDAFVPIIDVGATDDWKIHAGWPEVWKFFLFFFGWVLGPLAIAAAASLVWERRE